MEADTTVHAKKWQPRMWSVLLSTHPPKADHGCSDAKKGGATKRRKTVPRTKAGACDLEFMQHSEHCPQAPTHQGTMRHRRTERSGGPGSSNIREPPIPECEVKNHMIPEHATATAETATTMATADPLQGHCATTNTWRWLRPSTEHATAMAVVAADPLQGHCTTLDIVGCLHPTAAVIIVDATVRSSMAKNNSNTTENQDRKMQAYPNTRDEKATDQKDEAGINKAHKQGHPNEEQGRRSTHTLLSTTATLAATIMLQGCADMDAVSHKQEWGTRSKILLGISICSIPLAIASLCMQRRTRLTGFAARMRKRPAAANASNTQHLLQQAVHAPQHLGHQQLKQNKTKLINTSSLWRTRRNAYDKHGKVSMETSQHNIDGQQVEVGVTTPKRTRDAEAKIICRMRLEHGHSNYMNPSDRFDHSNTRAQSPEPDSSEVKCIINHNRATHGNHGRGRHCETHTMIIKMEHDIANPFGTENIEHRNLGWLKPHASLKQIRLTLRCMVCPKPFGIGQFR